MSLVELLPAIRELPHEEKVQLVHLLMDEVTGVSGALGEVPPHLRALLPPPGTVVSAGWQISTDADGMKALQQALDEAKGAG